MTTLTPRNALAAIVAGVLLALGPAVGGAHAETPPQTVPDREHKPGETLTDRLDRTDGVIEPPPARTPMQIEPPEDMTRTPVIKPPLDQQAPQGPALAPPTQKPS